MLQIVIFILLCGSGGNSDDSSSSSSGGEVVFFVGRAYYLNTHSICIKLFDLSFCTIFIIPDL
jgi:hypothetical protein